MKKLMCLVLCLLMTAGLLAGCGGANYKTEAAAPMTMNSAMGAPMEYAEEEIAMDSAAALTEGSGGSTANTPPQSRKWIITVYLEAETEDLDTMTAALEEHISALDGYTEDQSIYNGSSYANRRYRYANLTIRIPAEQVDAFTQAVSGIANVVSKEKNLEDITLTYVSTESRMKALQTEEARLLELLAQAETMSDLLEIEARLTDVRYELESVTSSLRVMDNQVNYATIHLNISEVQEYTPVEEPTIWERIRDGFKASLEGVGEGAVDFIVWLIIASPYILVWTVIALLVIFVLRKWKKNPFKRKKIDEQK